MRVERGGTTGVLDRRAGEKRGERERLVHVETRKHTQESGLATQKTRVEQKTGNESTSIRILIRRTSMYINEYKQTNQTVATNQAGKTDADAYSPTHTGDTMEVLPEAHGRSTEQHEPPEDLQKESYGERQRRSVRLRSDNTSSLPTRDPLSHRLPLFYSSRREAVCHHLHHINSLSFRTEIPLDSLPTEYYYLGFDFCTYLSTLYNKVHAHV